MLVVLVYTVLFMDWGEMTGYEGKKIYPFATVTFTPPILTGPH